MMSISRRAARATLLAAAALSAFLVATALSSLRDEGAPNATSSQGVIMNRPTGKQPPSAFDPRLRERMKAFREPRSSSDSMFRAAAGIDKVPVGLAVDRARKLEPPNAARPLWATPTADGACLNPLPRGAEGVAASCSTIQQVLDEDAVAATVYADDDIDINGLVTDDIEHVRLVFGDGTTQPVQIGDNAYSVHVTQAPVSIVLMRSDGSRLAVDSPIADP